MGGLRIFVNLLVDNAVLCELYPLKRNSCNEMDGVRLQAKRLHELEDYIDAQNGGPGKGWFRIVKDPFEARRVISEGKLAVIMGIEVSKLFDCGVYNGRAECTKRADRPAARRGLRHGRPPDGAHQQVRQRARRRRRRLRRHRRRHERRQPLRDRPVLGHADVRRPARGRPPAALDPQPQRRQPHRQRHQRVRAAGHRADLSGAAALQPVRASPSSARTSSTG